MNIAFFDFDGTITKKDTLIDFVIFAHGYRTFLLRMILLIPWLLLYAIRLMPNWRFKEKFLSVYFKGWGIKTFNNYAYKYATERVPLIVRIKAINAINKHKENKDIIVVVTASCENWVKPWCDIQNIDCIATRLEIKDDGLTGKFNGKNCYGQEKVFRIKQKYNLNKYSYIYAYGDSLGDKDMLELADIKVYKWEEFE